MSFEDLLIGLNKLTPSQQPVWGEMSSQRMVEHLSEMLRMAQGTTLFTLAVPEDKVAKMQEFLYSEKEMAKNIAVDIAPADRELRNDELELAIDEFTEEWINFIDFFEANPGVKTMHPFYGYLDFDLWMLMHKKHFYHHFKQFQLAE